VLITGRPANLRRWAASHLGAAPKGTARKRPPTDLRPIALAVEYAKSTSEFHQRLVYERVMALHVALAERRDLKPPVYLHLDLDERFPRVTIRQEGSAACLYGPFRQWRTAEKALRLLHRLIPLRPCDFVFEPDPQLPLGLGCLYAQVRTCAAPCLVRVSEDAYRALAREAAAFLARPEARPAEALDVVPTWVSREAGRRALVAEAGREGVELYPVLDGAVLEEGCVRVAADELDRGLSLLTWSSPSDSRDDRAWLSAWLHHPKRHGVYLLAPLGEDARALAGAVRAALASPRSGRPDRGVVT
jgi:hypothetical protein